MKHRARPSARALQKVSGNAKRAISPVPRRTRRTTRRAVRRDRTMTTDNKRRTIRDKERPSMTDRNDRTTEAAPELADVTQAAARSRGREPEPAPKPSQAEGDRDTIEQDIRQKEDQGEL